MTASAPERLRAPKWPLFSDRRQAGRRLAGLLADERAYSPVVVGLARGGVAVAAELAAVLSAPLDVVTVRKVGHPIEPEYAIGAVAPGGVVYLRNSEGLSDDQLALVFEDAVRRADELEAHLHAMLEPIPLAGRTAVLADDGLATGATMIAAARWAWKRGAARVVAAVPVGATASRPLVAPEVDELVILVEEDRFGAVGMYYESFDQLGDEDVLRLLEAARAAAPLPAYREG